MKISFIILVTNQCVARMGIIIISIGMVINILRDWLMDWLERLGL